MEDDVEFNLSNYPDRHKIKVRGLSNSNLMWPPTPTATFQSESETFALYPLSDSHETVIVIGNSQLLLYASEQDMIKIRGAAAITTLPSNEEYWKAKDAALFWNDMLISGHVSIYRMFFCQTKPHQ